MRLTTALAPLALVLALAGCTPPSPGAPEPPEPTPAETVEADPSPTSIPTPAPTVGAPAPDFGFTFYGDIQIGDTFAEHAAVGYPECPWLAPLESGPAGARGYTDAQAPTSGIQFFISDISDGTLRDARGIGLGSTLDELLAAYPDAVIGETGYYVTVEDPESDSRYAFSMGGEPLTVGTMQWGPLAGVAWGHLCSD